MRVYIGLGSNLGDRVTTIRRALELLAGEEGIELIAVSSLRETEPWGYLDQPPFVNGACVVETGLEPRDVLARLQAIERSLGRLRDGIPRFGPRALDLDILLCGGDAIEAADLVVPHPRLAERAFALEPLVELEPELRLPDGRRLADLLRGIQ